MVKSYPNLLVGTLYCGENEFVDLKKSLSRQTYNNWDHFVIKNLPNKEAHRTLYSKFMNEGERYDILIKVDADMVFNTDKALRIVVDIFESKNDLDHLVIPVRDWYSDSLIEGLHVFSNNVEWSIGDESLFVDVDPDISGRRIKLESDPAPIVVHSPNPSPFQSFRFGVHRGLKAVQPDRQKMRYRQSRFQWKTLQRCWSHFLRSGDQRLGLPLAGAEEVIIGCVNGSHYNNDQRRLRVLFQKYSELTGDEIRRWLAPKWNHLWQRTRRYIEAVGPVRLGEAYSSYFIDRVYEKSRRIFSLE